MTEEIWKDVVSFEGWYMVSDLGNVVGLDRIITHSGSKRMKIKGGDISKTNNGRGYLFASLRKNGKRTNNYIHRLVAKAFIPNPHKKPHINHINGDKSDNRAINLEWCTMLENNRHAHKLGLCDGNVGELCTNSTISDTEIVSMATLYATGKHTYVSIAEIFNTSPDYVFCILNRTTRRTTKIDDDLMFRVRMVQIKKKGLRYALNKEWFGDFLERLKAFDEDLWYSHVLKCDK